MSKKIQCFQKRKVEKRTIQTSQSKRRLSLEALAVKSSSSRWNTIGQDFKPPGSAKKTHPISLIHAELNKPNSSIKLKDSLKDSTAFGQHDTNSGCCSENETTEIVWGDSEEISPVPSPSKSTQSSPEILNSPSPPPEPRNNFRGSDWLANLDCGTSSSIAADVHSSSVPSSKFVKGGMAEQLLRLESREQSFVALWRHHQHHRISEEPTGQDLELVVRTVKILEGLILVFSRDHILVLPQSFPTRLSPGLHLRVHPPWQRLRLLEHPRTTVVLCGYYLEVVLSADHSPDDTSSPPLTSLPWTCPCKADGQRTPAVLCSGVDPGLAPSTPPSPMTALGPGGLLEVVPLQGQPPLSPAPLTILEAVEQAGGCSVPIVPVTVAARVLRVGCLNSRWFAIIQDSRGHFGRLELEMEPLPEAWAVLTQRSALGTAFLFSGLQAAQRLTPSSASQLFALLRHLNTSQPGSKELPAFCYCLSAFSPESGLLQLPDSPRPFWPHVPPTFLPISHLGGSEWRRCSAEPVAVVWREGPSVYLADGSGSTRLTLLSECSETQLTLRSTTLAAIDLLWDGASLVADQFSRFFPSTTELLHVKASHVLSPQSQPGDLVLVTGSIVKLEDKLVSCPNCFSTSLRNISRWRHTCVSCGTPQCHVEAILLVEGLEVRMKLLESSIVSLETAPPPEKSKYLGVVLQSSPGLVFLQQAGR